MVINFSRISAAFLSLICLSTHAQESAHKEQLWITSGFFSYHTDRSQDFNENNQGIGFEYDIKEKYSIVGGRFNNSKNLDTNYFALSYRPLQFNSGIKLGFTGGLIHGYHGQNNAVRDKWIPYLIPMLTYEYKNVGMNFIYAPEIDFKQYGKLYETFAIQIKLKIADF